MVSHLVSCSGRWYVSSWCRSAGCRGPKRRRLRSWTWCAPIVTCTLPTTQPQTATVALTARCVRWRCLLTAVCPACPRSATTIETVTLYNAEYPATPCSCCGGLWLLAGTVYTLLDRDSYAATSQRSRPASPHVAVVPVEQRLGPYVGDHLAGVKIQLANCRRCRVGSRDRAHAWRHG
jgi:Zn-finger nucleic acid-binding protein